MPRARVLLLLLVLPSPAGAEVGLRPFGGGVPAPGRTSGQARRQGGGPEGVLLGAVGGAALPSANLEEFEDEPGAVQTVTVLTAGATERDIGPRRKEDGGDEEESADDEDDDGDDDDDEWEEPYKLMSRADKVWLQCGWIFIFISIVVGLVLYSFTDDILLYKPVGYSVSEPSGALGSIYEALYGNSTLAQSLNAAIVLLAILNFYTYAEITEVKLELWCMPGGDAKYFGPDEGMDGDNKDFKGGCYGDVWEHAQELQDELGDGWQAKAYGGKLTLNFVVELGSTLFFAAITVLRIAVIHVDPEWQLSTAASCPALGARA